MKGAAPSILIADDEEDICRNMADILGDLGYLVDIAHNGFDALVLAQQHPYDMALLDLKMPGMDGLTLYRQIKKFSAGTVAIIVTAFATNATALEALSAGTLNVLPKPVDIPRLLELITPALERPLALLVDDDIDLCDSLWDVLNVRGYRLCIAHDENEAAERLKTRQYHMVLIDLKLPQGDGLGVFRKVQQSNPRPRTIAITGNQLETGELLQQMITEGAEAVCYKPFDIPALLATMERLSE